MNLGISWHIHTAYMPCEGLALTTCATESFTEQEDGINIWLLGKKITLKKLTIVWLYMIYILNIQYNTLKKLTIVWL